jgi:hypothetical protein
MDAPSAISATGPRRKIIHHLAALGIHEQGQQLRLILTSIAPRLKATTLASCGLSAARRSPRRIWRCNGFDGRPIPLHVVLCPFRVLTRNEPGLGIQAFDQRPEIPAQRLQRLDQPLRRLCQASGRTV